MSQFFKPEFYRLRGRSFRERFCLAEASGALGDLGTLIPLLAACAKMGTIRIGPAIFWMGIFNIISAIQWDIPMPVQPMKSIAAVAISDGMTAESFAASGILTGIVVMILGFTQTIELANKAIPQCVIAGMQIGLGTKMAAQGVSYWHINQWLDGEDSKLTMLICFLLSLALLLRTKLPTALIVFTAGIILTIVSMVTNSAPFNFDFIKFDVTVPEADDWLDGFVRGTLPQLPLTTLNSVVSVAALSADLFGPPGTDGRGATRVSIASSVGLMNIVGCWFGGMPSCHGAGGLAGQYKFGARGGMSILMLGIVKVMLAVCFGQSLEQIILFFPKTVLGVLLLFAGVELASVGAKALQKSEAFDLDLLPCYVTVGGYIGTKHMGLDVAAGLLASVIQRWDLGKDTVLSLGGGSPKGEVYEAVQEQPAKENDGEAKAKAEKEGTTKDSEGKDQIVDL